MSSEEDGLDGSFAAKSTSDRARWGSAAPPEGKTGAISPEIARASGDIAPTLATLRGLQEALRVPLPTSREDRATSPLHLPTSRELRETSRVLLPRLRGDRETLRVHLPTSRGHPGTSPLHRPTLRGHPERSPLHLLTLRQLPERLRVHRATLREVGETLPLYRPTLREHRATLRVLRPASREHLERSPLRLPTLRQGLETECLRLRTSRQLLEPWRRLPARDRPCDSTPRGRLSIRRGGRGVWRRRGSTPCPEPGRPWRVEPAGLSVSPCVNAVPCDIAVRAPPPSSRGPSRRSPLNPCIEETCLCVSGLSSDCIRRNRDA